MRRGWSVVALLSLLALAAPAAAQAPETIRIPRPRDAIAVVPGADEILLGAGFEERQFPGRVIDKELVQIGMLPEGAPASVHVVHRLTLVGLGDYSFRIPGPVSDLEVLPETTSRPGLRRGSIIWQGFSPGRRVLAAKFNLHPDLEAGRLPLRVGISAHAAGVPLTRGKAADGPVEIVLELENVTSITTGIAQADVDPAVAAAMLDAIRADLLAGRRPVPGRRGVPKNVPALGEKSFRGEQVEAPFRVTGTIRYRVTSGVLRGDSPRRQNPDGTRTMTFDRVLGGGRPLATKIRLSGQARGFVLEGIDLVAIPAAPRPSVVEPPEGAVTWADALERGLAPSGRDMLATAMSAMWRTARLRLYDAYVGSPDPTGPAQTRYEYRLYEAPPQGSVLVVAPRALGTFGLLLAAVAGLLLLFVLALQWAHA